jgi:hypothetical protein
MDRDTTKCVIAELQELLADYERQRALVVAKLDAIRITIADIDRRMSGADQIIRDYGELRGGKEP